MSTLLVLEASVKNPANQHTVAFSALTHTHTQPFYGPMDFVRDNLGEPVPEETFTHCSDIDDKASGRASDLKN